MGLPGITGHWETRGFSPRDTPSHHAPQTPWQLLHFSHSDRQGRRSRINSKMATASNPAVPPETRQLTADEGWDLIFSLFGSAKDLYAEYGGGEAWLKAERAAWADEPDR